MQATYGPLYVSMSGAVATVTINHPPTNLVDGSFVGGVRSLLDDLEADPTARVVIFRSADPDFFLMHGDVNAILAAPTRAYSPVTEPNIAAATFDRLSKSRIVSIGVIDGAARGGGAEFATALDLRFGSSRAVFGQPEVPMGILPGAGGTSRLPRLLGRGRALDIILTGRDVPASEARAVGWLDALVPDHDLEAYARAVAERIAAMPPASVAAVKRVVDISLGDITPALTAETDAYAQLTSTGGHRAPMQHFLDVGGQTREGETTRMAAVIADLLAFWQTNAQQ